MIFQHTWQKVLDGVKATTIRPVENWTIAGWNKPGGIVIHSVFGGPPPRLRLRWKVGNTYSVQPARTKCGMGEIVITAIERLTQNPIDWITDERARAEGFADAAEFRSVFLKMYPHPERMTFFLLTFRRA